MPSPVAKMKQAVAKRKEDSRRKKNKNKPYVRSSADHNEFADWDTGNNTVRSTTSSASRDVTARAQPVPPAPPGRRPPKISFAVDYAPGNIADDEDDENDDDDDDNKASTGQNTRTNLQSNQELLMPSFEPESYLRAHPSTTTLTSTKRSSTASPPLQRKSSSPLYTRDTDSPSLGRPGYIHRTHTPTGTKFSLKDHSPSQSTLTRAGTSSSLSSITTVASRSQVGTSTLTLADLQGSILRGIDDAGAERNDFSSPQHGVSDDDMTSMSGNRRLPRRKKTSSPLSVMPEGGNALTIPSLSLAVPTHKDHKRSNLSLFPGIVKHGPSDVDASGGSHGRRETPSQPTKAEQLKAARQKTVKKDPPLADSPIPDQGSSCRGQQKDLPLLLHSRVEESPARPSFEPHTFTPAEYQGYAQLRLAYAHALVLERAAGPLVSLYNGGDWPAQFLNPVTSAVNSSLGFAREAALSFRHDVKRHPLYVKFQSDGNDIGTRARNDVYQTGGDLREIRERIEDWEEVDHEEGVQVTKLMQSDDT